MLVDQLFRVEADFSKHPGADMKSDNLKLVRYQQNPTANWGPGARAQTGTKRKERQDA